MIRTTCRCSSFLSDRRGAESQRGSNTEESVLPAGVRCSDCNLSTHVCETVLRCKSHSPPSEIPWQKPPVSGTDSMRERKLLTAVVTGYMSSYAAEAPGTFLQFSMHSLDEQCCISSLYRRCLTPCPQRVGEASRVVSSLHCCTTASV